MLSGLRCKALHSRRQQTSSLSHKCSLGKSERQGPVLTLAQLKGSHTKMTSYDTIFIINILMASTIVENTTRI